MSHARDLDFIYATTLACRLIGRLGGALLGDRDRVVSGVVAGYRGNAQQSRYRRGIEEIHEESGARYSRGERKENAPARKKEMGGR